MARILNRGGQSGDILDGSVSFKKLKNPLKIVDAVNSLFGGNAIYLSLAQRDIEEYDPVSVVYEVRINPVLIDTITSLSIYLETTVSNDSLEYRPLKEGVKLSLLLSFGDVEYTMPPNVPITINLSKAGVVYDQVSTYADSIFNFSPLAVGSSSYRALLLFESVYNYETLEYSLELLNRKSVFLRVETFNLRDLAVTASKIADNAVTASKIASNAVTPVAIADNAVITSKIANNAVTVAKIADNAVTAPKIANNAVTALKMASDSVTTFAVKKAGGNFIDVLAASTNYVIQAETVFNLSCLLHHYNFNFNKASGTYDVIVQSQEANYNADAQLVCINFNFIKPIATTATLRFYHQNGTNTPVLLRSIAMNTAPTLFNVSMLPVTEVVSGSLVRSRWSVSI